MVVLLRKTLSNSDCKALKIPARDARRLRELVGFHEEPRLGHFQIALFDGSTVLPMMLRFREKENAGAFLWEVFWKIFARERGLRPRDHIVISTFNRALIPHNLLHDIRPGTPDAAVWCIKGKRNGGVRILTLYVPPLPAPPHHQADHQELEVQD
ncbi:hypothetical protein TorRG33x02_024230 [Trema orientale]|uniref:Uncharacterized protein n=1 Tax=Trema orientale TaxID=63057 RepID=A0A2P5FV25_TREOI|nr:hypothetical protein TorRG33x02_024230 [Trema orientale]